MPLARYGARSAYALGDSRLYGAEVGKDDAEAALLDGVAVAGLVGVLRQLGDLAEFAADVFHDLHELVAKTSSRGCRALIRVQNIEAALPSLEKAVKAQTSHIHFAYVKGSDWHANHPMQQNILLCSDLPQFMMDLYEECRDPPKLYLLDKYEEAGAGACMKRYSDPSYFKRTWDLSKADENILAENEHQKMKRKPSMVRNSEIYHTSNIPRLGDEQRALNADDHSGSYYSWSSHVPRLDGQSFFRISSVNSMTRLSFEDKALVPADHGAACVNLDESNTQYKLNASSSFWRSGISNDNFKHDIVAVKAGPRSPVKSEEMQKIVVPKAEVNMGLTGYHADAEHQSQEQLLVERHQLQTSSALSYIEESTADNFVNALISSDLESDKEASASNPSAFGTEVAHEQTTQALNVTISETNGSSASSKNGLTLLSNHLGTGGSLEQKLMPLTSGARQNAEHSALYGVRESTVIVNGVSGSNSTDGQTTGSSEVMEIKYQRSMSNDSDASTDVSTGKALDDAEEIVKDGPYELSASNISNIQSLDNTEAVGNGSVTKLWTNAGLFGLEPLKPSDCGAQKDTITVAASDSHGVAHGDSNSHASIELHHPVTSSNNLLFEPDENRMVGSLASFAIQSHPDIEGRLHNLTQSNQASCSKSFEGYQTGNFAEKYFTSTQFGNIHSKIQNSSPACDESGNTCRESVALSIDQENRLSVDNSVSSSYCSIAQRFLADTLQEKAFKHDSFSTASEKHGCDTRGSYEHERNHHESSEHQNKEISVQESSNFPVSPTYHYSGQSSPPLDFMKLSFHPISASETFKEKPESVNGDIGSNDDVMLQADHLLPSASFPLHEFVSDSEDDTFCISNGNSSYEDSPWLRSNSEVWDQDERVDFDEHGEYDNDNTYRAHSTGQPIHRMGRMQTNQAEHINYSSMMTVPRSTKFDTLNESKNFESLQFVELPSLDNLMSMNNQQNGLHASSALDTTDLGFEEEIQMPLPPPPPPARWMTVRKIGALDDTSSRDRLKVDPTPSPSRISDVQQEVLPVTTSSALQMLSAKKTPNHKIDGAEKVKSPNDLDKIDGQDQLLHQIRRTTANLRCTAKWSDSSYSRGNSNVTAIVKKANAIRQAVASEDGGEDDNWSDE